MRQRTPAVPAARIALTLGVLTLGVLALVAGCSQDPDFVTTPLGWTAAELSRDGVDSFDAHLADNTMEVTASAKNADTNSRMILWRKGSANERDTIACISFTDEGWPSQEGIALRIARTPDGHTRAITVMKNVWAKAESGVNVLLWDTATPTAPETIDSYRATAVQQGTAFRPYPWSLCARTVGDELTYMMWPSDQPQPSWDDKQATRRMTLPESVPNDGITGLYAGHIPAGTTMKLTMLEGFG